MSEEENVTVPGEFTPGEIKPVRKRATKKVAKKATKKVVKKVAKKRVVKSEAEVPVTKQAEMFSSDAPAAQAPEPKKSVVYSTDSSDEPFAGESPASTNEQAEPSREAPSSGGEGRKEGGQKQHNRNPKKHDRQNRNQNDRQGRNNKFNKNKPHNKKGKGPNRWQNKKKRAFEEESPIEFGELLEFEAFENLETIHALTVDLAEADKPALDYNRIYDLLLPELRAEVEALALEVPHAPNRDQLINALVAHAAATKAPITTTGILELMEDNAGGILVYQRDSYRIKALSSYVPQAFIEHYGLQRGHIVTAQLHPHRENESCPFAVRINEVMGQDPETLNEIVPFTEGIPYYPLERILMEADSESKWDNLSMRVVDCLTPIGFGQRGLIVAPPRTGKTVLMQGMANSIQRNYPDAHLIILLIDERPEEVTDFRRQVSGEVISSTFDESAESHVHAAEMVIEKARRMVEVGKDVVILLDSITRLARAYNTTMPSSGKILSGGVEANALQKPKRFFGSARNIEDGGSLTIIATALVETGSKMDEVIFEEFKGTGNMELHLDRGLSDKRIFPALSMDKSGTRKEELLYHPDEMLKIYSLRRAMKGLPSIDAMEMLIQRIKKTKTNAEFLMSVAR
ncbi:MAG: transcription termination factor Rho [Opitutaceae bacterium]